MADEDAAPRDERSDDEREKTDGDDDDGECVCVCVHAGGGGDESKEKQENKDTHKDTHTKVLRRGGSHADAFVVVVVECATTSRRPPRLEPLAGIIHPQQE